MTIRFLGNNGKVFPSSIFPETENTDPVKDLDEKKKRLQALKSRAAAKFKPIPSKILSLINKLDNMLQMADISSSVTESKIKQMLSQISSMIGSTKETKANNKNNDLISYSEKKPEEMLSKSESLSSELKKKHPNTILSTHTALHSRLIDQV